MAFYNRNKVNFNTTLAQYFSFKNETKSLDPLSELVRNLRETDFEEILNFLRNNEEVTHNFSYYLKNIFEAKKQRACTGNNCSF